MTAKWSKFINYPSNPEIYALLVFIMVALTLLLLSGGATACVNPTDSFASEVLLNKTGVSYNLTELKGSKNVISQEGAVIYRSHYNPDVAVILREINEGDQKGFSVRLQVPTELVNISYPQIRIEIESQKELLLNKSLIESLGYEIKGRVIEGKSKAELIKGNISIAVWSIKTDGELHSGVQIIILNATLTPELEKELASIVLSFSAGEEAWNNRKTTTQIVKSMDLVPSVNVDINVFDFSEAMKTELIWLRDNKIISGLTDADTNEIVKGARRGTAGYNSRIVYFNGSWLPYFRTGNPLLRVGIDCDGFPLSALPVGMVANLGSGDSGEIENPLQEYKRTDDKSDQQSSGETKETPQAPGFEMVIGILGTLAVWFILRERSNY